MDTRNLEQVRVQVRHIPLTHASWATALVNIAATMIYATWASGLASRVSIIG